MAETLPEINLTRSICDIWQEKLLLDYTIEVEDERFKVHKVVMASVSDYFKAMLTGGMVESQTDRVKLEGLNSLAVSNIIEYMYTNEISGTKASPEDFFACAVYLQIPSAIEAATQLLSQEVNEQNCFDILLIFQTHSLKDAAEKTEQYIKDHLDKALEVNKVETMPWESIATIVELWDRSEWDLFLMVKQWVEMDFENRKQHLTDIFSDLRFHLFSPAVIEDIRTMRICTDCEVKEGSWHRLLDEAMDYHNLPTHSKVNNKPPLRSKQSGVCLVKIMDNNNGMISKWHKNDQYTWMTDIAPFPEELFGAAAVIEVDNFLFVCGNYTATGSQNWYIFDPRTLVWTQIASFNTPRTDFALVYDLTYIYAMGGQVGLASGTETVTDSIERYDLEANTWTIIPSKLPIPLQELGACIWSSSIFVAGGYKTTARPKVCSAGLYACDTRDESLTWREKSPMPEAAPCHLMAVMQFNTEEVIVTMDGFDTLDYYNPRSDQWTLLDCPDLVYSCLNSHQGGTVLADTKDNALYFLDFYDYSIQEVLSVKWALSAESETITEHFIPNAPEWTEEGDTCAMHYIFALLAFPPSSRLKPPQGPQTIKSDSLLE